ncbi:tetratricopeptide repeat-containing sensor histidine kinase [Niabella insulamsoli]|uniref:ATP-binding protein n=1 Tax=Niabella insulamsoli TaxID=3144874 RepID=UPI0031FC7306
MKKLIVCAGCLLSVHFCFSQTDAALEAIEKQLRAATVDSEQVRYLYRLGDAYRSSNLDTAFYFADTAMKKAQQIKWQKGIAALHLLKGNILQARGSGNAALQHYYKAYQISSKRNDKKAIAAALNDIATEYQKRGDYVKAYSFFARCLKLGQEINDNRTIGLAYQNIGKIFYLQQEFDKALSQQQLALRHYTPLGDDLIIAQVNDAIGSIYYEKKNYKKAESYFLHALDLYKSLESLNGEATMYSRLGILYERTKGLDSSIAYELKAQEIWDAFNPKEPGSVFNLGNIGHNYFLLAKSSGGSLSEQQKKNYLQKAVAYTEKCVQYAIESNDREGEYYYLGNLSAIKEVQGDYKEALQFMNRSIAIRDSIFSQENRNQIAAIENTRAIESRDKQIKINQLALSNERRTRAALIAGAGFLFVIGCLLFYQSQARRKTNATLRVLNTELDEANQVKNKFFSIISHDLRSPLINLINFLHLQKEQPGLFTKEREAHHQKQLTESAENLLETMEAMLLWSKGQMERFAPQKKPIAVRDLFTYIRRQFAAQYIEMQLLDPEQAVVNSDEDYLKAIMYNLTSNAIKALSSTDSPQIIWRATPKAGGVELSITDNGPGIHPEQLDALYNEHAVVGTRHGLGMHLIRDLAKAIDCKVQHHHARPAGTTFQLII